MIFIQLKISLACHLKVIDAHIVYNRQLLLGIVLVSLSINNVMLIWNISIENLLFVHLMLLKTKRYNFSKMHMFGEFRPRNVYK